MPSRSEHGNDAVRGASVFPRDMSDGVPGNLEKMFADYCVPVCYPGAIERKWESANWVSRSSVSVGEHLQNVSQIERMCYGKSYECIC